MSDETKATIEIIEHYWQKGGFYNDIPVEIMNTIINELEEKDKEIERLNNIINDLLDRQNEALRYIGNHLSLDSRYKHGNGDEELILVRKILNKHTKELKGSDK